MNTVVGGPDAAVFMDSGLRRNDGGGRNDGEGRNDGWDRALARFRTAQAAVDAAAGDPDQERYDGLADAAGDALCALLALPAPDLSGLAVKLDVIVPHFAWELTGSEDWLEILRRDAHRLSLS